MKYLLSFMSFYKRGSLSKFTRLVMERRYSVTLCPEVFMVNAEQIFTRERQVMDVTEGPALAQ